MILSYSAKRQELDRTMNMSLQERILLSLSRAPMSNDYDSSKCEWTRDNSLSLLKAEYPDFGPLVSGKRLVDFGCGMGFQSISLAQDYGCSVVGIDTKMNRANF